MSWFVYGDMPYSHHESHRIGIPERLEQLRQAGLAMKKVELVIFTGTDLKHRAVACYQSQLPMLRRAGSATGNCSAQRVIGI
jgi:hypothetical protein